MFFIKTKNNKNMKLVGYLTLIFVKLMYRSGSMEAVSILSEFSRCLSEISREILLFLYFITEKSCSQSCVLPKSDDVNKV